MLPMSATAPSLMLMASSAGRRRRQVVVGAGLVLLAIWPDARLLAQTTLVTGLVAHWTFDEGAGSTIADTSGQGNNGTLVNGGSAWTTGYYGGALYFPGTTGLASTRVEIPNTLALQNAITTAVTFAAWVRVDDINRDAPILAKEGPAGLSYWFGAFGLGGESSGPGNFGMLLDTGGGQPWSLLDRNQGSITPSTWVHLASTWNGTQVTHYLNGVMVAGGGSLTGPISTTTNLLAIGANAGYVTESNATAFLGSIDELYLYDRELTLSEINQLMNGAAIPEPAAFVVLAGLGALGFAVRWRRPKIRLRGGAARH